MANYEPSTIELYDLNSDIGEETNLSPEQLAIKWQLWVRLRDYLKLVQAQMPNLDPTYRGTTNGTFALAAATGPLGDADSSSKAPIPCCQMPIGSTASHTPLLTNSA